MSRQHLASLEGGSVLSGYSIPLHAPSLRFTRKGDGVYVYEGRVEEIATPIDVYMHSLGRRGNADEGRWGVLCQVLATAVCPTDSASVTQEFGAGEILYDDPNSPAVPGHEFVARVVAGNEESLRQLERRGIKLGDLVTPNINHGCRYYCEPCSRQGSIPFDCESGVGFTGLGSFNVEWVREQTGRIHLPGAYTRGFVVMPEDDVYGIPTKNIHTPNELALFTNADGLACAIGAVRDSGISSCQKDEPRILIFGSGRCGTWHGVAALHYKPGAVLHLADISGPNLRRSGEFLGVPEERQYSDPSRGVPGRYDFIIDTAGHGVLDGTKIVEMMKSNLYPGGRFWSTTHIAVLGGVTIGDAALIIGRKMFGNSISPGRNFDGPDGSVRILSDNVRRFLGFVSEIPGGLESEELPEIVKTGGGQYKERVGSTALCSFMASPGEIAEYLEG